MLVLAIDTALAACSAGVLDSVRGAILAMESVPMERGHAEALMPMLDRVMRQARADFDALDRVAVTVGPGSFTGLRVGVSAARGIALAAAKPVVGLSTLAAFAAPAIAADSRTPVLAVIDARHAHVYLQLFAGGRIDQPRIAPVAEAVHLAIAESARIVGSATRLIEDAWPDIQPRPGSLDHQTAPDIEWVARLASAASVDRALPKPLYLRAPDAQPQGASQLARRC